MDPHDRLRLSDRLVDLDRRVVVRPDGEVGLTSLEARLLAYLAAQAPRAVSRDELLREVWDASPRITTRSTDQTIFRLRRKLEPDPSAPIHLVSAYGAGYRLEVDGGLRTSAEAVADDLVGRDAELAELAHLLRDPGLTTIVAPGGMGKTRLARRFLAGVADSVVVEAGRLTEPRELAWRLSAALGSVRERDPGDVLAARGPTLVVLDAVEELGPAFVGTLAGWLARARGLRVLATSRTPVGVPGERILPLAPLPDADAAAVFVARARDVRPGFSAAPDDVRALVQLVGGHPLSLELAAGQVGVLGVREVTERLASPDPAVGRVLDHAWASLSTEEAAALARLAVFAGPFDAAAAERAADVAPGVLDALRRRALVAGVGGEPPRLALLDLVRESASARLGAAPSRIEAHAAFYAERWARATDPRAPLGPRVAIDDLDELLAAFARVPHLADGVRAGLAAWAGLERRSPGAERELAGALVAAADALGDADLAVRARLLLAHGERHAGDPDAALRALDAADARADEAWRGTIDVERLDTLHHAGRLDAALQAADRALATTLPPAMARKALALRGRVRVDAGRVSEGRLDLHRAQMASEEAGDLGQVATYTAFLGHAALFSRDPTAARDAYARAEALARSCGMPQLAASALGHLGSACLAAGDPAEAERHWTTALAAHRRSGNARFEALIVGNLANLWLARREPERAIAAIERATAALGARDPLASASLVGNLGAAWHLAGDLARARTDLEDAVARQAALGRPRSVAIGRFNLAVLDLEDGRPDAARAGFEAARATLPDLATAWLALLSARSGDATAADTLLATARAASSPANRVVVETVAAAIAGLPRPDGPPSLDLHLARRIAS